MRWPPAGWHSAATRRPSSSMRSCNHAPTPPVRLNPDLPVELERIINRAIEKDRDVRYQTASDLRAELKRLKRDTDSGRSAAVAAAAIPEDAAVGTRPPERRRSWAVALGTAAVITTAIFGYLLTRPLPVPKVPGSVQITKDGRAKFAPALTDGSRLYYMAATGSGAALYQISIAGGEAVPISRPLVYAGLAAISADDSELLVQSWEGVLPEGPLWVFPALAGSSHRVGSVSSSDAAWSPDGQTLSYTKEHDLFLSRNDGTEARKLATVSGWPLGLDGRLTEESYALRWENRTFLLGSEQVQAPSGKFLQRERICIAYLPGGITHRQSVAALGRRTGNISFSRPHATAEQIFGRLSRRKVFYPKPVKHQPN